MSIWTIVDIVMYVAFIGALILTATKWLLAMAVICWVGILLRWAGRAFWAAGHRRFDAILAAHDAAEELRKEER